MMPQRPNFQSAEEWLTEYQRAVKEEWRPWEPQTRDELLLAEREGLLLLYPAWIPGKPELKHLELPDFFGRKLAPYGPRGCERLLRTMLDCPAVTKAMRDALALVEDD